MDSLKGKPSGLLTEAFLANVDRRGIPCLLLPHHLWICFRKEEFLSNVFKMIND